MPFKTFSRLLSTASMINFDPCSLTGPCDQQRHPLQGCITPMPETCARRGLPHFHPGPSPAVNWFALCERDLFISPPGFGIDMDWLGVSFSVYTDILVQGLQRIKTVWKRLHKRNRQATNRCKPTVFTCFGPWVQTSKPDLPVSAPATKDPFIFWYLLQCLANFPCLPYLRLDPPSDLPFTKPCWCAGSRKWRLRTAAAMGTWSFARRATFSLSSGISSNLGNKKWLHKVLRLFNFANNPIEE